MALRSLVKVGRLSSLSDARYCAGMGVEMLGFQVVKGQPGYVPPEVFQEIRGWISGPRIVAELYGIGNAAEVRAIVEAYAPDLFEIGISEWAAVAGELPRQCLLSFTDPGLLKGVSANTNISHYILDRKINCGDVPQGHPPLLARVSSPEALDEKIKAGCYSGFVLNARAETRPGVTNYDELADILEALEEPW